MRAELRVDGEPRPLPAAVELAGYRVVQESLTNAIRYAAGAAATVHLAYRDDGIMVEVTDDGPGAAAAAAAIRWWRRRTGRAQGTSPPARRPA